MLAFAILVVGWEAWEAGEALTDRGVRRMCEGFERG